MTDFAVSSLHLLITAEPPQVATGLNESGLIRLRGPIVSSEVIARALHLVTASIPDIITWRTRLNAKYRAQLIDPITWDEPSDFLSSITVAASTTELLAYLAAALDQRGPDLIRTVRNQTRPDDATVQATFAEATRRGFAGRFPQLLLDSNFWFPFDRHLVIEEPDWRGVTQRYGSSIQLAAELQDVRDFIAIADPRATAWPASRAETPTDILAAAWQASDAMAQACATAIARNLPLYFTATVR